MSQHYPGGRPHSATARTKRVAWHIGALALALLAVSSATPAAWADKPHSGATTVTVYGEAKACHALDGLTIPASAIGLPSLGAVVDSAILNAPNPSTGRPEFCLVTGRVVAVDHAAPPINFEVNLPTVWNLRSLQMGGGGFDGVLVTGLAVSAFGSAAAPGQVAPINLGYVTFGSDGGTSVGANPQGSFALSPTALANYAGESVKRTRDVATAIMQAYYQRLPLYQYFEGGSKGGQEALLAAERYGDDYNGIIAYYPATTSPGLVLSWYHLQQVAYARPGGYLDPAKQELFVNAAYRACDGLDGLVDGVISNVQACGRTFKPSSLRCPGGKDTGDSCLSDAQIGTLESAIKSWKFAFPLANGLTTLGGFPLLSGANPGDSWLDQSGRGVQTNYNFFDAATINYFFKQLSTPPPTLDLTFDYTAYKSRLLQVSKEFDTTNPNMDVFVRHGGKLIMVQGDIDMLVTPAVTNAFYQQLQDRYGGTNRFMRYYTVPGFGHAYGAAFNLAWDPLKALDQWAADGQPPRHEVAYDGNAPRSRPLCEYPSWPRYRGGDPNSASSFTCLTTRPPAAPRP